MELAKRTLATAAQRKIEKKQLRATMIALLEDPAPFLDDAIFGALALAWRERRDARESYSPRETPAPFRTWGEELDELSLQQMRNACALPIAVTGALMPDAHVGYGLPIGGVLATRQRRDPLCRRRGYRLPHEIDRARFAGLRAGAAAGTAGAGD